MRLQPHVIPGLTGNLPESSATPSPDVNPQIANKIMVIRDVQAMIDRVLEELYGVETKVFNQAVKRNIERFPDAFRFQLDEDESLEIERSSRSQFVIIENADDQRGRHTKYLPYAFTEHGVTMLSAVLHSERAVMISIEIMSRTPSINRQTVNLLRS